MNIDSVIDIIVQEQKNSGRALAIILAGHNGSGKSTLWRRKLSDRFQIPLVNADRMMLSILPEPGPEGALVPWARTLRDTDPAWMKVAQNGVQAFVGHAMAENLPLATETVFSHWIEKPDGSVESKIDLIRDLQRKNYFGVIFFVGLNSVNTSLMRVQARVADNGHDVVDVRLRERFPRTQKAIHAAIKIADAAILLDNSRDEKRAFTVCQVQTGDKTLYDIRTSGAAVPVAISQWLDIVGA